MAGILYVVYNEAIRNPETNEKLYKIGITKNSVSERYYGLGLKMPGKFETLFAYRFEDYAKAEQLIHGVFSKYRKNGEWFNLNQKQLDLVKANCEEMGGILITNEFEKGMEAESERKSENKTTKRQSLNSLNIPNLTDTVDIHILEGILKRNVLHVNDNICFHTTVDVLNGIFGKTHKQGFASFGKSYFITKEGDKSIWFAPLNAIKKGVWTNTMPDEEHVYQEYIDKTTFEEYDKDGSDSNRKRAIFVKKPGDVFRFVGIFIQEKHENNFWIFKRVSTELHLQEWDL